MVIPTYQVPGVPCGPCDGFPPHPAMIAPMVFPMAPPRRKRHKRRALHVSGSASRSLYGYWDGLDADVSMSVSGSLEMGGYGGRRRRGRTERGYMGPDGMMEAGYGWPSYPMMDGDPLPGGGLPLIDGYPMPGGGYPMPGGGYPMPGGGYPMPGGGYPMPGGGYPMREEPRGKDGYRKMGDGSGKFGPK
jgi:hypothetical protein